MAKKLVHKHDELAKSFLTDIGVAKEFLEVHLVPDILKKCDLATLTIDSGSYIDTELRKRFSDIVYKLDLREGGFAYIYTLIEHQSSAEKLMPLRILKYQLEIIYKHIKEYGEDEVLPIVVPLVFYNGEDSPYPYPTSINDLVVDKELFSRIGLGTFKLIDLTITDDDEILKHKKVALLEMLLKHIRAKEFVQVIEQIMKALAVAHQDNLSKNLFESMLSYLTEAKEEIELKLLFEKIIEKFVEYKEDIMTYAEHYTQKGMQQGMQQGMQKAQYEIAEELLKLGVEESIIAKAAHLTIKEIRRLKKL